MKKYRIILSFLLCLLLITGSRKTIFAQGLQLDPVFQIENSTDVNFDFRINLWPTSIYHHNFVDNLTVTNEFAGKKTTVTKLITNYPRPEFFFPIKWTATPILPSMNGAILEEPNNGVSNHLIGKIAFAGRIGLGTIINTDFEYVAANEQTLLANKKVNESFIALTTPMGDATLKFDNLNINANTSGIKYLLLASGKHQTRIGNSVPATYVDYDLSNVSTSFRSPLPSGWTPVSNVVTVAVLKKSLSSGVNSQYLTSASDLIIKYDEYGLQKKDEMNIALFYQSDGEWRRYRCKGEQGVTLDTLNNTFTAKMQFWGTFVLAALDKVHYSTVMVKPNTISYRFAADTLLLGGSVDSTGMLQAFAGKEIILTDGFTARPGSVLSLKLTGDYCGAIQQSSTAATRQATNQVEMQVSDEKTEREVLIYPNPTNGSFTIVYDLPSPQRVRIAIKDITGREIKILQNGYQDESTYKQTYQINDMSSGVYFVELVTETEKPKVVKLVKQ